MLLSVETGVIPRKMLVIFVYFGDDIMIQVMKALFYYWKACIVEWDKWEREKTERFHF
jgi:hypothetical protein